MQRFVEDSAKKWTAKNILVATAVTCAGAYATRKIVQTTYPKIYEKLRSAASTKEKPDNFNFLSVPTENAVIKSASPRVSYEFAADLYKLIRIVLPGIWTREFGTLVVHSGALIARTFLSIYVAALDGKLARSIVQKDLSKFLGYLLRWIVVSIPCSFVNSLLRYLEKRLGLSFRNRLANYSYNLYFNRQTYYKIGNLDARLSNPDECLTEDIRLFSDAIAHLYSHVTKPLLDIVVIVYTLKGIAMKRGSSWTVPLALGTLVTFLTSEILKLFSPRFGKLVSEESQKRGYLRHIHSRIITNSEEIAFYGGHKVFEYLGNVLYTFCRLEVHYFLWWYSQASCLAITTHLIVKRFAPPFHIKNSIFSNVSR